MNAIGIIAEYNPFHKGHLLHINETKKRIDLPVIAVISGNFMQRGEPAFADKWLRTRMAVDAGADLVLELPTAFSLRSAEFFAKGGVDVLKATGVIKFLSCGAENAALDYSAVAKLLLAEETQTKIRLEIERGLPYAKACSLALGDTLGVHVTKPNNILALEYAKALLGTDIKQIVIPRTGSNYNDTALLEIASATAVRGAYAENADWKLAVPESTAALIAVNTDKVGFDKQLLWQLLLYRLRTNTAETIYEDSECKEGLENLLLSTKNFSDMDAAVAACTNKRYPASRIRRLLMQLLLNKKRHYFEQNTPAYIRVLGFNDTGRQLLSVMKNKAELPLITKLARDCFNGQSTEYCRQLELDIAASDITALLRPTPQPAGADYTSGVYYRKNI